jgi:hypothetical protein
VWHPNKPIGVALQEDVMDDELLPEYEEDKARDRK